MKTGRGGGIKCMRKHVTRALMTFWKFLSRKIIELHLNLNLHTTISINTVTFKIFGVGGGGSSWGGNIPGPPPPPSV